MYNFSFGLPKSNYDLVFTILIILLIVGVFIALILFIKYAGKGTVEFIREALSDPSGRGEVKSLLAVLITTLGFIPLVLFGFFFKNWAPEGVFIAVAGLILGLLGLGSVDYRSAMKSGLAIMKPDPPEILVNTNPAKEAEPEPETDFVLKK